MWYNQSHTISLDDGHPGYTGNRARTEQAIVSSIGPRLPENHSKPA
jgi:hypothetical protein